MTAVSCVGLTKDVVSFVSSSSMMDAEVKPVPFTVSVVDAAPAWMLVGLTEVMDGAAGVGVVGEGDEEEFEDPPPQPAAKRHSIRERASASTRRLSVFMGLISS